MKKRIIIITSIIISVFEFTVFADEPARSPQWRSPLDFFQEEITLSVNDSIMRVEGVYHMRNNTGRKFDAPLAFPFHVDSLTLFPHEIEAIVLDSVGNPIKLEFMSAPEHKIIRFRLPVCLGNETVWKLNYEQKIKSKKAIYIITSTAAWKKPLEQATYTFVTPRDFEVTDIWPAADTTYQDSTYIYRQCVKRNFMPTREMELIWK